MNAYSLESPRAQTMLDAARAMGPVLRERAAACKAGGQVPKETIADFHEAGFFKVLQPEQWGGYAMDPQVFYAVGLEVARFPRFSTAAGRVEHTLAPDHVEQNGQADRPEEDKAEHHGGYPCALALVVKPRLGLGEPARGRRGRSGIGHHSHNRVTPVLDQLM